MFSEILDTKVKIEPTDIEPSLQMNFSVKRGNLQLWQFLLQLIESNSNKNQFLFRIIKMADIAYITVLYFILGYFVGYNIDKFFEFIYGSNYSIHSTPILIIQVLSQIMVIGIISSSDEPDEQAKAKTAGAQFWIIKSDEIEPRLEEFKKDFPKYKNHTAAFKIYK
jgi:hypothetical protein